MQNGTGTLTLGSLAPDVCDSSSWLTLGVTDGGLPHFAITGVSATAPGDAEIREALAGNLCRCTGYEKILDAVRLAAARMAAAQ